MDKMKSRFFFLVILSIICVLGYNEGKELYNWLDNLCKM